MKTAILLVIGLISIHISGQTIYTIQGFSEKYSGIVTIEKGHENHVLKKGTISIIDTKTNNKVLEFKSDELTFDLDKHNAIQTNVVELPYGEQSTLVSQDFNFDGVNDLAIMDGQFSCYGGPSFQIYLDTSEGLQHSPEFTRLAQEYCGMFQTNYETKTIHTMTKSGCCWHQFSTFKVVDNIPKPISIVEEDVTDYPFHTTTTTTWNADKKQKEIEKTIDLQQEGITTLLSFTLAKNQKQVIVFNMNNQTLYYTLLRPNTTIEFLYPPDMITQTPDFEMNKTEDNLVFKNQNATYEIYETRTQNKVVKVGILVEVNGKSYDLKGNLNSLKGSLKNLKNVKSDNLVIQ